MRQRLHVFMLESLREHVLVAMANVEVVNLDLLLHRRLVANHTQFSGRQHVLSSVVVHQH